MTDLMNSSEAREAFWHEGYMFVQGYLSVSTATLAARYALMQYRNQPRPEEDKDRPAQVPGAHSVYADPLAESILDLATGDVSELVGRHLVPSYAFYRVYRAGDTLKPHTDRVSCEISASLCLDHHLDDELPWPLGLRTNDEAPVNIELEQAPGDLILYRGSDCIHWRRRMRGGPDAWQAQLFLHWVDADGPYANVCAFDTRPALGLSENHRDPQRVARMQSIQTAVDNEKSIRLRSEYLALGVDLAASFDVADSCGEDSFDAPT